MKMMFFEGGKMSFFNSKKNNNNTLIEYNVKFSMLEKLNAFNHNNCDYFRH